MPKSQRVSRDFARGFGSDNFSGIHPKALAAIAAVNTGHAKAYGNDPVTSRAEEAFRAHFGVDARVYFVFNGTAANVLSLTALTRSFHSVFCAEGAHLNVDECGAPEKNLGCKLIPVPAPDGKVTVERLAHLVRDFGNPHKTQPRVLSLSQATELGTAYTPAEIRKLARFAHGLGLRVHMDGARLANAAAHLGISLKAMTRDCGVDVLSFGGTKNGLMCGEAVVFFHPDDARDFPNIRKQGMQLASKMRFVAAQFQAYLSGNLWLRNARHANRMARLLAQMAGAVPGVEIVQRVEANSVFARLPQAAIAPLQEKFFFYVWNEERREVRWMCSFDTEEKDLRGFATWLRKIVR